ncbi:UNVERIFIED_ORG: thermostable 8-oxoguanine DNA glycosylase [Rhizobium pisi]
MTQAHLDLATLSPDDELMPGVKWGKPEWVPSPAYWASILSNATEASHGFVSPNASLFEEVGFCLLGGFGVTAEMNHSYFELLRDEGIFDPGAHITAAMVEGLLSQPLMVLGRKRRYRFPRQKASRIVQAMAMVAALPRSHNDPLEFRKLLLEIPGVGPKTASWITRNWLGCDEVAILDIHVIRAGRLIGLFEDKYTLPKDYDLMEAKFLSFCGALGVKASLLDAVMWSEMRRLGRTDI